MSTGKDGDEGVRRIRSADTNEDEYYPAYPTSHFSCSRPFSTALPSPVSFSSALPRLGDKDEHGGGCEKVDNESAEIT